MTRLGSQGETGLVKRDLIHLLLRWRDAKVVPPSLQQNKPLLEDTACLISALDLSSDITDPFGPDSDPSPTPTPKATSSMDADTSVELSELDSLNLVKIQAKDLKKGFKVGSGGFKDVCESMLLMALLVQLS